VIDKCSCGWQVTEINHDGCYIGTPIVGDIKPKPKMTRSQKRYQDYLDNDGMMTFREWLGISAIEE
jgi:hypothetical protein